MAIQFVSTGGRLVIKSSSGGSTLHSGVCATQTSYRANTQVSEAQCQESTTAEKFVSRITHELSGTYNYQVTDTTKLMGLGASEVYAIYFAQNGTTLFAGSVIVTSVSDDQGGRGNAETQSVTLQDSAEPDVGFGA